MYPEGRGGSYRKIRSISEGNFRSCYASNKAEKFKLRRLSQGIESCAQAEILKIRKEEKSIQRALDNLEREKRKHETERKLKQAYLELLKDDVNVEKDAASIVDETTGEIKSKHNVTISSSKDASSSHDTSRGNKLPPIDTSSSHRKHVIPKSRSQRHRGRSQSLVLPPVTHKADEVVPFYMERNYRRYHYDQDSIGIPRDNSPNQLIGLEDGDKPSWVNSKSSLKKGKSVQFVNSKPSLDDLIKVGCSLLGSAESTSIKSLENLHSKISEGLIENDKKSSSRMTSKKRQALNDINVLVGSYLDSKISTHENLHTARAKSNNKIIKKTSDDKDLGNSDKSRNDKETADRLVTKGSGTKSSTLASGPKASASNTQVKCSSQSRRSSSLSTASNSRKRASSKAGLKPLHSKSSLGRTRVDSTSSALNVPLDTKAPSLRSFLTPLERQELASKFSRGYNRGYNATQYDLDRRYQMLTEAQRLRRHTIANMSRAVLLKNLLKAKMMETSKSAENDKVCNERFFEILDAYDEGQVYPAFRPDTVYTGDDFRTLRKCKYLRLSDMTWESLKVSVLEALQSSQSETSVV